MTTVTTTCWCCGAAAPADGPCPSCGALPRGAGDAAGGAPSRGERRRADGGDLGPRLAGRAAGVGARLAAFTVDVLALVLVVAAVWLPTRSPVLTAVVAVEAVVALWVWQARTGLTVGNAVLRLRTARDDRPWSPGAGPAFVRLLVTGLGALVAVVGAWGVVASAALDRSGRRRSWADRAAGTVVVAVPRRRATPTVAVPPVAPGLTVMAAGPAAATPDLTLPWQDGAGAEHAGALASSPPSAGLPPVAPAGVRPGAPAVPAAPWQAPGDRPGVLAEPLVVPDTSGPRVPERTDAPPAGPQTGALPAVVGRPGAGAPVPVAGAAVLLVVDTGQRELVPLGAAVVLGRSPEAVVAGDRPVVLQDPESTVSRRHLRLEHTRDGVRVTDLGSANGTAVLGDDGEVTVLPPHTTVLLVEGDRVRVGRRVFTVSSVVPEA
ncbi:FHA domain-containing protein [Cellulomonas sp. JZ18]|uniref:FHA domain-containing protein n=1 Tax=Cellulomonas sp. JZ18 TaxID=2654191 RepID=UPI0012D3B033|nr:FHA domain-containing protein [Cellulomonas sp. JZ18]QGQ19957.1 FHA domain-containing protein [Cellulomonas sp. JZ18]